MWFLTHAWIIPALMALSFLCVLFFGKRLPRKGSEIGIVFVAEAGSVMIQRYYFRATGGRRFFRMAPIHLHFQLGGWSETQVTQRFMLVSILAAMCGVALALV